MIVDKGNYPDNWIDPSGTGMFLYALAKRDRIKSYIEKRIRSCCEESL